MVILEWDHSYRVPPHSDTATHALRWRWKSAANTESQSLNVFQRSEFSLLPKDCPSPELSPPQLWWHSKGKIPRATTKTWQGQINVNQQPAKEGKETKVNRAVGTNRKHRAGQQRWSQADHSESSRVEWQGLHLLSRLSKEKAKWNTGHSGSSTWTRSSTEMWSLREEEKRGIPKPGNFLRS